MRFDAKRVRRLLGQVVDAFRKHHLLTYTSAIAFQALIALVPLTLLGLGLLGAFGLEDTWRDSLAPAVRKKVTPQVFDGIDSTVEKIVRHGDAGLLVFAALLATWYLAAAVRAIMEALNALHGVKEDRPVRRRALLSAALAVVIEVCVIGAILAVVVFPRAVDSGVAEVALGLGRWALAVLLLGFVIGLLVRYAPAEKPETRWASAGTVLVIGAWIVASLLFRLWVDHVANFKTPIGSLTMLLVLTGYLFVSALIFLVGVQVDELLRKDVHSRR